MTGSSRTSRSSTSSDALRVSDTACDGAPSSSADGATTCSGSGWRTRTLPPSTVPRRRRTSTASARSAGSRRRTPRSATRACRTTSVRRRASPSQRSGRSCPTASRRATAGSPEQGCSGSCRRGRPTWNRCQSRATPTSKGLYLARHNPPPYYADLVDCSTRHVPYEQLANDLAADQLPGVQLRHAECLPRHAQLLDRDRRRLARHRAAEDPHERALSRGQARRVPHVRRGPQRARRAGLRERTRPDLPGPHGRGEPVDHTGTRGAALRSRITRSCGRRSSCWASEPCPDRLRSRRACEPPSAFRSIGPQC